MSKKQYPCDPPLPPPLSPAQNKAETDLYLRQIEAGQKAEEVYGKGVELVVPEQVFVIKSKVVSSGEKVYINVCKSTKVRGGGG